MSGKKTISLTGTPGTGKSSLAENLLKEGEFEILDLNKFIKERELFEDTENDSKIVDPKKLNKEIKELLKNQEKDLIIEGHLSYLLPTDFLDYIVILRTNPEKLRERLEEREYPTKKIHENVEAEAIGIITSEAIDIHGENKIIELNTTNKDIQKTSEELKKGVNGEKDFKPGKIDWLEDYSFEKHKIKEED